MLKPELIPSTAPIPPAIMASLLKHMARFAANPYKPNVTPVAQPRDMDTPLKAIEEEQRASVNPSPKPFTTFE